ncbi:hypothetical protein K443DRAFT_15312 [Laccaria amethystina LaAM-08-1]|uniref:Uncharacterized protein n=1 Tax=Laccaria amethystina LaAM-08-1 TaxID=1095629 RepID=A0A0C9WY82_9AGAR|nr:hypothetical protein K443DRAFT_15312 [Laccaria amethystina LaAM-08-1]
MKYSEYLGKRADDRPNVIEGVRRFIRVAVEYSEYSDLLIRKKWYRCPKDGVRDFKGVLVV